MWRSKKFIIIAVLVAVVAVGSTVGVVLAQDSGGTSQSQTIFERVATILQGQGVSVTGDQLQSAFTQARQDQQDEAINNRLQALVDSGKLTQAQADEFKAWLTQRPDLSQAQQQMKDWLQSRPQIPGGVLGDGGTAPRAGMMRGGMMPRFFGGR